MYINWNDTDLSVPLTVLFSFFFFFCKHLHNFSTNWKRNSTLLTISWRLIAVAIYKIVFKQHSVKSKDSIFISVCVLLLLLIILTEASAAGTVGNYRSTLRRNSLLGFLFGKMCICRLDKHTHKFIYKYIYIMYVYTLGSMDWYNVKFVWNHTEKALIRFQTMNFWNKKKNCFFFISGISFDFFNIYLYK